MASSTAPTPSATAGTDPQGSALVEVVDLRVHFPQRSAWGRTDGAVRAVDGVSLRLRPGETLGLVGESGCGKSTLGRAVLRLVEPTVGRVLFDGRDLAELRGRELRALRREMQIVFQDPFASLDPRQRVGSAIEEPLVVHGIGTREERQARVRELLEMVGLDAGARHRFPHAFSGGQRQRICIARALATRPRFLVADEPVSALDVSIQAQIVNLLADLRDRFGLTYLFIAHDLAVVRHLSDRVAVMYLGRIVEEGEADAVFGEALHPYTRALLSAIPVADPERRGRGARIVLEGDLPSPAAPPSGCRFHTRCPHAVEQCRTEEPPLREEVNGSSHRVACHRVGELAER